ncbi:MAG TPA: thymidine kinase [Blastocatellia bacterium]|jgi:thymidine kinase|nr:thymidine kinase [Blastocatellia bacterium]
MDGVNPRGGWIEVITGGMFSGKSEELIRRIRRAEIARQRTQIFKPAMDNRFDLKRIISRDNRGLDATAVNNTTELRSNIVLGVKVVGIDEVQFFDQSIVDVCMEMADAGVRVIAAGLDQDYLRRPFGPMPALLAVSEYVSKMHAVCVRCGGPAHYSQRVSGGNSQIEVGDISYEARCRQCFEPYRAVPVSDSNVTQIKNAVGAMNTASGEE